MQTALMETVEETFDLTRDLPPTPQVAQKAAVILRDPSACLHDLAEVLVLDQAMTGLVLKWVNSAYFGLWNPVATVQQAVVYLGQRTLESLFLTASASAVPYFEQPSCGSSCRSLWKHSIGMAAGAKIIAGITGIQDPEVAYHAGLLCDIGKLALEASYRHSQSRIKTWSGQPYLEFEKACYGVDHATLGAEIAQRWNLPEPIQIAIACHHTPSSAGEHILLTATVHLADAVLRRACVGSGFGMAAPLDLAAFRMVGLKESRLQELSIRVEQAVREAEDWIGFTAA